MSKKRALTSIESIEIEYKKVYPAAARMCEALRLQIEEAAKVEAIDLAFPIEARVKSLGSVVRKLRGNTDGPNINKLIRLQDLVGLRLVVFFERDLEPACQLLASLFPVRKQKQIAPEQAQFGYQSIHCIIDLSAELLNQQEFEGCTGMSAEVQIRTLAQHCWAAASHKLHYKTDESVALSIKRPLDRVAALLEIIDSEFERLLETRDEYRKVEPYEPDDAPLNVDNIEAILRKQFPDQQDWFDRWSVSSILEDLLYFSIITRGQLNNLLNPHCPYTLEEPTPLAQSDPDDYYPPDESPGTLVLSFLSYEFPERFKEYRDMKVEEAFRDFAPEPL